jgi:ABC-type polysaccharide/polyol phosphate transport system ATPase subunit
MIKISDLTGGDNIVLNGVLLGLTRSQVMEKIPSIILFSGLDDFIHVPIRTYSSGMYLRLAFSVAIHKDPRIFVIDEVLSVGDEEFQEKSKEALLTFMRGGVTTILASHSLQTFEDVCTRVLWLEHGELVLDGPPDGN